MKIKEKIALHECCKSVTSRDYYDLRMDEKKNVKYLFECAKNFYLLIRRRAGKARLN